MKSLTAFAAIAACCLFIMLLPFQAAPQAKAGNYIALPKKGPNIKIKKFRFTEVIDDRIDVSKLGVVHVSIMNIRVTAELDIDRIKALNP